VLILTVYPFFYVVVISLNDGVDSLRAAFTCGPASLRCRTTRSSFRIPNGSAPFGSRSQNGRRLGLTVFFTCLVAYGLSQENLLFRRFYNIILLLCMYFYGGLIPYYLTLKAYGMLNTFWVYVIPTMFSTYYCILAISFFREIPAELKESARLDGANEVRIFLRIILPRPTPAATLALSRPSAMNGGATHHASRAGQQKPAHSGS
jgi:putative aldouronate transport system permease protein